MDADFWHGRWRQNEIAFHEGEANVLLARSFDALALHGDARVFVPLCGKTRDIAWLLSRGCRVVGAELSALAVTQLFESLGLEPEIATLDRLSRYSAADVEIFVGDVFDLTNDMLGPIDAAYDRAALVALPEEMRERYAKHLTAITGTAPQLLICFEYDQKQMNGPPFSVSGDEVLRLYAERYTVTKAAGRDVAGGLKGRCPATEIAWLLRNNLNREIDGTGLRS